MFQESQDDEQIIARVAALDIGKAELVCCSRVPSPDRAGRRLQEVTTYSTMTRSLQGMADRLLALGVTRVVMEATSDYWKPAFYLLEAAGFEVWLVNAKDVKAPAGAPEGGPVGRGVVVQGRRASDDPPQLRPAQADPPAAGPDPVPGRAGHRGQRGEAQIKLSVVASDIFGVSGRDMMAALIGGERDPQVLAQLARARMRVKIPQLQEAFVGHFDEHHAFLLAQMLGRIDAAAAGMEKVDARIKAEIAPFADAVTRLDQIPGVGVTTAQVIIAEIGVDMTRFPTPAHLASWAKFASGSRSPPGATRATARPGTATATWPVPSARPPRQPPRPTPSSANATDGSPAAARRRRPW